MTFVNEVICGKCEDVLALCPGEKFNLIFTSPPYADIAGKYKDGYKAPSPKEYPDWFIPKAKEFYRVLNSKGSFILNIDDKVEDGFRSIYVYELVCRIVKETGFKLYEHLYWEKGKSLCHPKRFRNTTEYLFWFVKGKDFTFNLDEMRVPYSKISIKRMKKPIKKRFARTEENQNSTVYKNWAPNPKGALPSTLVKIGSESQRICDNHVATFPLKLPTYFIKGATNPDDLVLDPFGGTMTTCLAAKNLGRNWCGIDADRDYCKFGETRLL